MLDKFRELWRHAASPVTIITTSVDKQLAGMTISSLTSVSLGPPKVLVSFNCQTPSRTASILQQRNKLVLNLLGASPAHVDLAKAFAGRKAEGHSMNPFDRYPELFEQRPETEGIPLVKGSTAQLLCDVHSVFPVQDHEIVVASVLDMWADEKISPLLYRNHNFWRLGDTVK